METEQDEILKYTVKELIGSLNEEARSVLISDCVEFIKLYINKPEKELRYVTVSLESLTKFYTDSGTSCNEYLTNLFDTVVPLLTDVTPNSEKVFKILGDFLQVSFCLK